MKTRKAILVLMLVMAVGFMIQSGCTVKTDPTMPNYQNFWQTVVVEMPYTTPATPPTSTPVPCTPFLVKGYTATATVTVIPADQLIATKFNLASSARIWELGLFVPSDPTSTARVRLGIYTDTGADWPVSLVLETGEQSLGLGMNEFSIPATVLTAGDYWLAVLANEAIPAQYLDGGTAHCAVTDTTYGSMPANFGSLGTWNPQDWRMWINYCTP